MIVRLLGFLMSMLTAVTAVADTDYLYSTMDPSISKPKFTDKAEPRSFWGLSEDEWARYEKIMTSSPWAVWEHNATPLALLAFYSDSEKDKRRYARRQAELDQWREAAVIEWQQIYNQEREKVHQTFKESLATMPDHKSIANLSKNDQVLLFIDLMQCKQFCRSQSRKIIESGAKAHFYFFGNPKRETIFQWASQMEIPVEIVRQRKITLNTDKGEGRRYGVNIINLSDAQGARIFYRHLGGVKELL